MRSFTTTPLFICLLSLGIALALSGCNEAEAAPETIESPTAPPPKVSYPTTAVSVGNISKPLNISGRVAPLQEATLSSKVPGMVLASDKLLQVGKYYRKGETMVRLDDEQLRYGLQAERAALLSSLTQLLPELSLDYASEYPRWESFINAFAVDKTLAPMPKIDNVQLRHFINSRGIPAQYYAIKAQESTLDDYQISAPFSGQITMANVEAGSYIQPGAPLAKISRSDVYEIVAEVSNDLLASLPLGKKMSFRVRGSDQTYSATVNRYGPTIDASTQTIPVYLRASGQGLRSGLFVETTLATDPIKNVSVLPKEAVSRTNEVYAIEAGRIVAKPVEVVSINADKAYLRGLNAGDEVITISLDPSLVGTQAEASR